MVISPTITASNLTEFNNQLNNVKDFAQKVHLDLMDGVFTTSKSLNIDEINNMVVPFDAHIMYLNPEEILDQVLALKPITIVVQFEANVNHQELTSKLKANAIKSSLAILQQTSVDQIKSVINLYDQVLIFSGNLGYQGGTADLSLLSKAREIRSISNVQIAWDGGINAENIKSLADGGVEVFNVGAYIQDSANAKLSYQSLLNKIN